MGQSMGEHEVRFLEQIGCGVDVATFRFSKPEGYTFLPGQYLRLSLDTVEGAQTKPFTHCSAPSDSYLEITTRLSGSPFKNALLKLASGDRVGLAGPAGRLVLPADARRVTFLVGGVGITPVRSMLREAAHRGLLWEDAAVFYGNRDLSCTPFLDELQDMRGLGVRVIPVIEHADPGWAGAVGFITAQLVRDRADPTRGIFLTSGPAPMVDAMERVMDELGIEGDRRMVERFGSSPTPAPASPELQA